jgi:hypothetical protein
MKHTEKLVDHWKVNPAKIECEVCLVQLDASFTHALLGSSSVQSSVSSLHEFIQNGDCVELSLKKSVEKVQAHSRSMSGSVYLQERERKFNLGSRRSQSYSTRQVVQGPPQKRQKRGDQNRLARIWISNVDATQKGHWVSGRIGEYTSAKKAARTGQTANAAAAAAYIADNSTYFLQRIASQERYFA